MLKDLVALYDTGRREPLPLPLKTSCAWAEARHNDDDPVAAAEDKWKTTSFHAGENDEPAHSRVWGRNAPLEKLLGAPRRGEEVSGEETRLGALAMRLWLPLLTDERSAW